jgi:hypothetical protein
MSTDNRNELPPPDLSSSNTPGWQVGLVAGLGAVITLGVLLAMQQDYRTAIEVGSVMVALGIFLAIGLITERTLVSRLAAIILIAGGVLILGLGILEGNPLWMAGGFVVLLAGELVLLRDRIIPRDRATSS